MVFTLTFCILASSWSASRADLSTLFITFTHFLTTTAKASEMGLNHKKRSISAASASPFDLIKIDRTHMMAFDDSVRRKAWDAQEQEGERQSSHKRKGQGQVPQARIWE